MLHAHCGVELHSQKITFQSNHVASNDDVCPCFPRFAFLVCQCIRAVVRFFSAVAPVVFCPTCWCRLRFTNYQGSLRQHTVMTVDVLMTCMQCLHPSVMSHLEQAACLCFVNRGLGDMTFTAGPFELCTKQRLLQQSIPHVPKNQCSQRHLTNQSPQWIMTDDSDVSLTNNRCAKNNILGECLK